MRGQLLLCALWAVGAALASQRVVVTFHTREWAAAPYALEPIIVVKQYGRRLVLDLGIEAEFPGDALYIADLIGASKVESVEPDELVSVSQEMVWAEEWLTLCKG